MLRTFIAALAVALAVAAPAEATTILQDEERAMPLNTWVAESLVPTPDTTVAVTARPCPRRYGHGASWCTDPATNRIWTGGDYSYLWSSDFYGERDRLIVQLTFMHELGHVYDNTHVDKGYRRWFSRIMGYRGSREVGRGDWTLAVTASSKIVRPYEQFAMAYSLCSAYPHHGDAAYARSVWWGYGYEPTVEQFERSCFMLRSMPLADREHLSFTQARRIARRRARAHGWRPTCIRLGSFRVLCVSSDRDRGLVVARDDLGHLTAWKAPARLLRTG